MHISRNWLSDWVEFSDLSDEAFEELITTRVAEVDEVHFSGTPLSSARIAKVLRTEQHPEREKLTVAVIQAGEGEVQVVCGAPNCRAGMLTAYVPPGGVVLGRNGEGEVKVGSRELAGVRSDGVLVSEAELGIGNNDEGIIELSEELLAEATPKKSLISLEPGASLAELFGGIDTLLEIDNKSLTHRPDLWSHFGFAREIGAILGRPLTFNADTWADVEEHGEELFRSLGSGDGAWSVEIAAGSGCRRFSALEIQNVKNRPSPFWMRRRLFSIDAGVRNLLVDLSNYIMHDIGQPNHAYDADLLKGQTIYVRRALEGEVFHGLDGEERNLTTEDIAIADASGCVALGGVMGGAPSAIREETTRLLLEAANFDPVRIRHTTKRHQLRTDASNRFEKSLSPYQVPLATQRFVSLLKQFEPSAEVRGRPADSFPEKPAPVSVLLNTEYIRSRLGAELNDERISGILSSLGFMPSAGNPKLLEVPYYRATRDISIEDDLVEEIGRINGYENIPEAAPRIESRAAQGRPVHELEYRIQDCLTGLGFSELYHYSFMNAERAASLGYSLEGAVEVLNPVDATKPLIRSSLVPGMLEMVEQNSRYRPAILLFELGRGYQSTPYPELEELPEHPRFRNPAAYEHRLLSLAYTSGKDESESAHCVTPPLTGGGDFYALLSVIRRITRLVTKEQLSLEPIKQEQDVAPTPAHDYRAYKSWMHPYRAATIRLGNRDLGVIAEVRPGVLKEAKGRVVSAELSVELLLSVSDKEIHFKQLPKFPGSYFEMSVVMPKRKPYRDLESLLRKAVSDRLLRHIEVLSVYEGTPLPEGSKSISVKLFLGSDERTLGGEELQQLQGDLMQAVHDSPFELRG